MTQLADPKPGERVLDIGTGSGCRPPSLPRWAAVWSIGSCPPSQRRGALRDLNYKTIEVRTGDGLPAAGRSTPPSRPFFSPPAAPGGSARIARSARPGRPPGDPVGEAGLQHLVLITKQPDGTLRRETVVPVAFVPMTGEVRKKK